LAGFVVLANAPDLPLPGWGHDRYFISHSVFVTSAAVLIAACAALAIMRAMGRQSSRRLILAGAMAWYSHLLLDTFYNHGKGLAIFWPVSDARIALPLPWFSTMRLPPIFSSHNVRVWLIEAAAYGALLAAAVFTKHRHSSKSAATLM
jgi:hypothetical protein